MRNSVKTLNKSWAESYLFQEKCQLSLLSLWELIARKHQSAKLVSLFTDADAKTHCL
jgi:hypothetical protein